LCLLSDSFLICIFISTFWHNLWFRSIYFLSCIDTYNFLFILSNEQNNIFILQWKFFSMENILKKNRLHFRFNNNVNWFLVTWTFFFYENKLSPRHNMICFLQFHHLTFLLFFIINFGKNIKPNGVHDSYCRFDRLSC
jgi:hypothetical protein